MIKKSLIVSLLIMFSLFTLLFTKSNSLKNISVKKDLPINKSTVVINGKTIFVEIADTSEKLSKGLSGRSSLPNDSGMLFVFSKKDQYPAFWMKDMLIPLEFIWINDDIVSQIDKNVFPEVDVPESLLKIYRPKNPIDYVLEVDAGFSDTNGIKEGDKVIINI